jgi:hypothetical protein
MDFTSFVKELGIDQLPEDKQQRLFASVFRTLNMRVTVRLAHEMTEDQKRQFEESLVNDDETAMEDLERVYPNIRQVYQEELDGIKDDMKALM